MYSWNEMGGIAPTFSNENIAYCLRTSERKVKSFEIAAIVYDYNKCSSILLCKLRWMIKTVLGGQSDLK